MQRNHFYPLLIKCPSSRGRTTKANDAAEIKRLKKELKRVTDERDILKKAAVYFANQSE